MAFVVVAVVAYVSAFAGMPQAADAESTEIARALETLRRDESVRRGGKIFRRSCAACHGRTGSGDGPAARELDPRPRDLTTADYRFRSTANGALPAHDDLLRTIHRGLPGTGMPAFVDLFSAEERNDLAEFLFSLQPAARRVDPPPSITIAEPPPPTPGSVAEGRALYLLVGCWRCHGLSGSGNGPSARDLVDDRGNRIHATDFRYDPFKGGREPIDVVRALRTGLNGTPMPSYDEAMMLGSEDEGDLPSLEGRIGPDDIAVVRAFLAASPGSASLGAMPPAERDALRDRRIAALADYVLSLDRRRGAAFWLFRERPLHEAAR